MPSPTPPTPGTTVAGMVTRVEPFGVFVRVEGEPPVHGFIRPRDWSWSRRIFDLGQEARPGARITAQVLRFGERGQLELSRRLTLPDPFPEFQRRHKPGEVVAGVVTLIAQHEKGVIVELDEGVEGFIPRSEIPAAGDEEGFGLLAQDRVAAEILGFEDGRVRLSIKSFLHTRDRAFEATAQQSTALRYHPSLGPSLEQLRLDLELGEIAEPSVDPAVRARVRRVLVVEDSPEVSDSLEMVFEHLGFCCQAAASVEAARARLAEERFDLLILDVNLPTGTGAELVAQLGELPAPRFVFVLTATAADEWHQLVHEGAERVTCFFQKPTSVARLLEQLARLAAGLEPNDDRSTSAGLNPAACPPLTGATRLSAQHETHLEDALEQLRRETRATTACLLAYRPGPRFELVAGRFPELGREVQQALEMSPIGDVIRQRRYLAVADVKSQGQRFKHLLRVLPLRSFAGHALDHADQADYGLFLIGEQPQQLQNVGEERLRAAAHQLGHVLAQRRLDEVIAENQNLLLTGFLSDSLLHEIKNELQALNDYAAIQLLIGKRHAADLGALDEGGRLELKRSIVGIQGVGRRLGELVVLFRNLAGQPREETFDLSRGLERLAETVKPFAERHSVAIILDCDPDLPALRLSPKLLDQPILNVMINAIEQMVTQRGTRRRLSIAARYRPEDAFPILVSITDSGRGIHHVHRERIFELFFTTKERGTGMGLYIARFFIEQLGGRLRLARSLMFAGSELTFELPREVLA